MNIRNAVELHIQNANKESSSETKNVQELNVRLEKLLLTDENKPTVKK